MLRAGCRFPVDLRAVKLLLQGAELLDPEAGRPVRRSLLLEAGRIAGVLEPESPAPGDARRVDLAGLEVAPGFLDLHHHGALANATGAEAGGALRAISFELAAEGVTGFLATTVTLDGPALTRVASSLTRSLDAGRWPGAEPLGIHLEGPWIEPEAAGAHRREWTRRFDPREGPLLLDLCGSWLRMVTLAPELPGAATLLAELRRRGVVAAAGHSLAEGSELEWAVAEGLGHATHLWNAMGPFHHRRPGLAAAVLAHGHVTCDLICDGIHVDPLVVRVTSRVMGDRLALITDRVMTASWRGPSGGPPQAAEHPGAGIGPSAGAGGAAARNANAPHRAAFRPAAPEGGRPPVAPGPGADPAREADFDALHQSFDALSAGASDRPPGPAGQEGSEVASRAPGPLGDATRGAAGGHFAPDPGGGGLGPLRELGGAVVTALGRLAGSALRMDAAVRNLRAFAGVDRIEAVRAATATPARILGIERERGTLRPGARADLVVLDADGRTVATLVAGRLVHGALPGMPKGV